MIKALEIMLGWLQGVRRMSTTSFNTTSLYISLPCSQPIQIALAYCLSAVLLNDVFFSLSEDSPEHSSSRRP